MEGEDLVETAPMPEGLVAWVQAFVERHHVDQPFVKRKRKRVKGEERGGDGRANELSPVPVRRRGTHG